MRRISENDEESFWPNRLTPFRACSAWRSEGTVVVAVCEREEEDALDKNSKESGVKIRCRDVKCHDFISLFICKLMIMIVIASLVCLKFE